MPSADDSPSATPQGKPAKSEPFAKGQLDFDIAFYDRILERDPNFVDVLRCQGELLSRKGLHERALVIDRSPGRVDSRGLRGAYNLACSLAVSGHRREAITALRAAPSRATTISSIWKTTAISIRYATTPRTSP